MKITIQFVILTLSLLLVNADQYCDNLIEKFKHSCNLSKVTLKTCCEYKTFLSDHGKSGLYKIHKGTFTSLGDAYCDMTNDGGGWNVIQRNKKDSSISFNKNWTDYEKGFGDLNTEFWYGLEEIHCLTQRGQWEMRLDYQKNDKTWSYLHYNQFSVGSASEEYPLTAGEFTGVGTDWLNDKSKLHNGLKFTTPDKDNDKTGGNCAVAYKSGWWYNHCYHVNINRQPPVVSTDVLFSEMKIRPKDCITQ